LVTVPFFTLSSNTETRFCFPNTTAYLMVMSSRMASVHWLLRAEDARSLAEEAYAADARGIMMRIASGYEKLAQQAASLADSGLPIEQIDTTQD
jgi:hypothetical protein